jgi:hypothetical protein
MKRIFLFLVIFTFSSLFLKAQMNTGSKFVAGYNQLGLSAYSDKSVGSTTKPDKYFNLDLTTKAGYFLKNRIAVGGMINYSLSKINYVTSALKASNTEWSIGPLARYYVEYGTLIPFAEASFTYGMRNSTQESASFTSEIKHSVFGLNAGIGADYFLNQSIALEGMLGYSVKRLKPATKGATGQGHTENGFGCSFGVIFYFGTI